MKNIEVSVIRNDIDYKKALKRIGELLNSEPGSQEFEELELLTILIDDYENQSFTINEPDPISIIYFVMEQRGLKQIDLVGILGEKTTVSKVLNRKRPLTLEMVRNFSKEFHIPADLLIQEYELV
jgi:HTH-type transcriptional regulator / antitoxin HigA